MGIDCCLVVNVFIINIFEAMWARFFFEGFESERVDLEIGFVIPYYISMVFDLVRSVIFLTFRPINTISECSMFPFLAVLYIGGY